MKPALWTGSALPSSEQLVQIKESGFRLVEIDAGPVVTNRNTALASLYALAGRTGARSCFGQYQAHVQEGLYRAVLLGLQRGAWPDHSVVCYTWLPIRHLHPEEHVHWVWLVSGVLNVDSFV